MIDTLRDDLAALTPLQRRFYDTCLAMAEDRAEVMGYHGHKMAAAESIWTEFAAELLRIVAAVRELERNRERLLELSDTRAAELKRTRWERDDARRICEERRLSSAPFSWERERAARTEGRDER